MILGTHARIANRVSKDYLYKGRRALVIFGSILPDINPLTQPHREANLVKNIKKNEDRITSTNSSTVKYICLGNILHYLCDYFCYAHVENIGISHGLKHQVYEFKLGKELKQGFAERLSVMPIEQRNELMENLSIVKKNYDLKPGSAKRDLKYTMSAVEYCIDFMFNSNNFKLDFAYKK